MLESTATQEQFPSLRGKVRCDNCNVLMDLASGTFSCPTPGCRTPETPEDELLRAVMTILVDRVTTDETLQGVTRSIRDATAPEIREQTGRRLAARHEIATLTAGRAEDSRTGELEGRTRREEQEKVNEFARATGGLVLEETAATEELDRLNFMADSQGIRETARDLDTYLNSNDPEYVQELLDLLVEEVRLSEAGSRTVYREPFPPQGGEAAVTEDRLPLL